MKYYPKIVFIIDLHYLSKRLEGTKAAIIQQYSKKSNIIFFN